MKAITLWRPWNEAIIYAGKPVENRTWRPPRVVCGQDIALHNGKTVDEDICDDLVEEFGVARELVPGPLGIVAVARLDGYVHVDGDARVRFGVDEARAREIIASRWFNGPVGWVLSNVRRLAQPVACKGAQGLWTVPADIESAVREQVERAA